MSDRSGRALGDAGAAESADAPWAAAGDADANETYMGMRLTYNGTTEVEAAFAEAVSSLSLLKVLLRSVLASIATFIILFIPITLIAYSQIDDSYSGRTDAWDAGLWGFGALVVLSFLAFLISFFIPFRELMSDWNLTLEDKGPQAARAFAAVEGSLRARALPVTIEKKLMRSPFTGGYANSYLIVHSSRFNAYLSLLPYGSGLFMSWSLWRTQIPLMMILRFIGENFGRLFGQDELQLLMQTEPARAMREAVHNAMREGVEAATMGAPTSAATASDGG